VGYGKEVQHGVRRAAEGDDDGNSVLKCFPRHDVTRHKAQLLIEHAVAIGSIQPEAKAHANHLCRLSKGIPRILEELLIELAGRRYEMDKPFGWHLLDIDRRIHEFTDDALRDQRQDSARTDHAKMEASSLADLVRMAEKLGAMGDNR
jgi:hypothetical protein